MLPAKLRTILIMTALYIIWILMVPPALILLLLDPFKQRLVQPMVRAWGKVSLFMLRLPVKITGLENLKGLERSVLVCNHTSAVDIPLILGNVPRRIGFLAKKQVVYIPVIGQILLLLGHVLVDRSNPRQALKSIKRCTRAINKGISVALFPEGTRTTDGQVQPFKAGSLRIPVNAEAPVIPISIYGGHKVMRKNELTFRKHPLYMHIGRPISSKGITKDKFRGFVDSIQQAVQANVDDLRKQVMLDFPQLTEDDK